MVKAIDVHGFGGGLTLGTVQAGWDLAGKLSRPAGFGVINALENRSMLPGDWDSIAAEPDEWPMIDADMVIGNPPCAAFSSLNPLRKKNGDQINDQINDYMWELVRYAGRVKPQIVVFESVQAAFKDGLSLMRQLHAELETISGLRYNLVHLLHNNASVGGSSLRRRYFWVATRVPFGVEACGVDRNAEPYEITYVPRFRDILTDLAPLATTFTEQPYRGVVCPCRPTDESGRDYACTCGKVTVLNSSPWCRREVHDGSGVVDGHQIKYSNYISRARDVLYDSETNPNGVNWLPGERLSEALKKYYEKNGNLPESWRYSSRVVARDADGKDITVIDANGVEVKSRKEVRRDEYLISNGFLLGVQQPIIWRDDRLARVIVGNATEALWHPWLRRPLSHREIARIQGFPDDWKIWPMRNVADLGPAWGKGVPVQAGRWGAYWARKSLEGEPGTMTGVSLDAHSKKLSKLFGPYDNELVIDVTNHYKPFAQLIGDPG